MAIVLGSAESLLTLLNGILDFSKIEAGKLDLENINFSLRDTVTDALQSIAVKAAEKELELACHIAANVPDDVVGDPTRIRQIMVNLAGNAIKFTDQGEVLVTVELEEQNDDLLTLHISVSDTGIGIPNDKLQQIFESFSQADATTTRRYGGTGLGLTISNSLVNLLGGKLWVESVERQGSVFHFTTELTVDANVPKTVAPEAVEGVTVLIVDDNESSRIICREMLTAWGMVPTLASSGEEALDVLKFAASGGNPFSLVLSDVTLPEMDGFELARQIQNEPNLRSCPVMMLSSSGKPNDLAISRKLGIARCLPKPVKQSSLLNAIARQFGIVEDDNEQTPVAKPKINERLHLLLADDGVVNYRVATKLLENLGHTSTWAKNGSDAVKMWRQGTYNGILMDIQMPILDGVQATAESRKLETTPTYIIAMTAHAMKGDKERCLQAGMDDYVAKPLRAERIAEALAKIPGRDGDPFENTNESDLLYCEQLPGSFSPSDISTQLTSNFPTQDEFVVLDIEDVIARIGDDLEFFASLTDKVRDDFPDKIETIRNAIAENDVGRVRRVAHSIKGLAGNLGGKAARQKAIQLETLAKNECITELTKATNQLDSALAELLCSLERETSSG